MKKIRIAQIGMNRYSHAPDIFITLKALPELFDIAGYALVEDERETCADKLHVFDGYPELTLDEILRDPTIEAVAVETDEIHLTKYTRMAARHGKHIHMQHLVVALRGTGHVFAVVPQPGIVDKQSFTGGQILKLLNETFAVTFGRKVTIDHRHFQRRIGSAQFIRQFHQHIFAAGHQHHVSTFAHQPASKSHSKPRRCTSYNNMPIHCPPIMPYFTPSWQAKSA